MIRIYVADLAAYNQGILHGAWLDAVQEPEDLLEQIKEMLLPGNEEWSIDDTEGFYGIRLHRFESIEKITALARCIVVYGEPFAVYVDNMGLDSFTDERDMTTQFEDAFVGIYDSETDFASELVGGFLPFPAEHQRTFEFLMMYFDTDSFSRDLFINDYVGLRISDGVAVFHNL